MHGGAGNVLSLGEQAVCSPMKCEAGALQRQMPETASRQGLWWGGLLRDSQSKLNPQSWSEGRGKHDRGR